MIRPRDKVGLPERRGEPVIELVRFGQAVNRLEVLRGVENAPERLAARLLRKYPAVNFRMQQAGRVHNIRLIDLGPWSGGG